MIAFEIFHNGRRLCIAGAEDLCVLTTHITAAGVPGKKTVPYRPGDKTHRTALSVGGLTKKKNSEKDVHVNWTSLMKLKTGDRIEVRVIETEKADKPLTREKRERKSKD